MSGSDPPPGCPTLGRLEAGHAATLPGRCLASSSRLAPRTPQSAPRRCGDGCGRHVHPLATQRERAEVPTRGLYS